ncbi:MAG TPA: hypothetical protein VH413_12150 [Verrucomicrobiae bacterium]|jgi:hypothetical protein|nr:hypothetical protein [Verrucomicrobiae bacterium]
MRVIVFLLPVIFLVSCSTGDFTRPDDIALPTVYFNNVYVPGGNPTVPSPNKSHFLQVERAGFVVLRREGKPKAYYFLKAKLLQKITQTYRLRTEFEDSKTPGQFKISDTDLPPDNDGVLVSSSEPEWGIQYFHPYTIKLEIFAKSDPASNRYLGANFQS